MRTAELSPQLGRISYRRASARDAEAVAELHADSWRRHYRGAYSDAYLDGNIFSDRLATWTQRLKIAPSDAACTIVAERDADLIGFAHTILREHPEWGALLDNLHVRFDYKRSGIGTRLMSESARFVFEHAPGSGLYLGVLEINKAAQAFYEARGGQCVRRGVTGDRSGGTIQDRLYYWADPSVLLQNEVHS
jgi:ribosomal protein S18 acetylase RimI-like enzyme